MEASFLKDVGIYGNVKATNTIMREFMHGRKGNLSQDEQNVIKQVSAYNPFEKFSRQKCRDLFMFMAYQDEYLSWSDLPLSDLEYDLGGFHLHLLAFPFVYQFNSRIKALV